MAESPVSELRRISSSPVSDLRDDTPAARFASIQASWALALTTSMSGNFISPSMYCTAAPSRICSYAGHHAVNRIVNGRLTMRWQPAGRLVTSRTCSESSPPTEGALPLREVTN